MPRGLAAGARSAYMMNKVMKYSEVQRGEEPCGAERENAQGQARMSYAIVIPNERSEVKAALK